MPTSPKLTITLTGRPPVTITRTEWPIVGQASEHDHDGQNEFQANRTWRWSLKARQHADGRAVVYGHYDYDSQFQGERGVQVRAGQLVAPGQDLPSVIQSVALSLADLIIDSEDETEDTALRWRRLIAKCVGSLPAEELA